MNHYRFFYLIVYEYLKTLIIMARIDLKFLDLSSSDTTIQVEEDNGLIYIKLFEGTNNLIQLDKSTAIKFAKTLRTEINKIKEDVNNV